MINCFLDTHNRKDTAMLTSRQALIVTPSDNDTAKMQHVDIPKTGNARIKALLALDFKAKKVNRAALRAACGGISSQAVSNWLATGTISKENLDIVSTFTGRPVEQYLREQPDKPSAAVAEPTAIGWYASRLKPVSDTRQLVDQLGDALDTCTQETRTAVASLLQQYALNPKPGPIADAIVMFLERCRHPNADNPFAGAAPPKSTQKGSKT